MSIAINTSATGLTETLVIGTANQSVTVQRPTDAIDGVMMIAIIASRNYVAIDSVLSIPSGWNTFLDDFSTYAAGRVQTLLCWKVATGSEPSDYTWSWTGGAGSINAHIFCATGVDSTNPADATPTSSSTTGVSPTSPSITTVTNNAVILGFACQRHGGYLTAIDSGYPSSMTGGFARRSSTSSTATTAAFAWETIPTAGATGTREWTNLYTTSFAGSQYTVALRPAATGSTLTDIDGDETLTDGQAGATYTGTGLSLADDILVSSTNTTQTSTWAISGQTATGGTITSATRNNLPYTDVNHTLTATIRDGSTSLASLGITFNPASGYVALPISDSTANKTVGESGLAVLGTIPDNSQVVMPTSYSGHAITFEMSGSYWTGRLSFVDWVPTVNINFTGGEYRPGDTGVWESLEFLLVKPGGSAAPSISAATINGTGTQIVFTGSEPLYIGAGGNGGFSLSMSGGAVTATYVSGSGSYSLVYSLSRTIAYGETGTYSYTQPGNGIENSSGNDLDSIVDAAVSNGVQAIAPVLSGIFATQEDATSIRWRVSTDTGAGQLLIYASSNSSENEDTVMANCISQAVSSSGLQTGIVPNLTTDNSYYVHIMHDHDTDSAVSSSSVVTLQEEVHLETLRPAEMNARFSVVSSVFSKSIH